MHYNNNMKIKFSLMYTMCLILLYFENEFSSVIYNFLFKYFRGLRGGTEMQTQGKLQTLFHTDVCHIATAGC